MVDNYDDIIDSRDVIMELDELQSELDTLQETVEECNDEVSSCEDILNSLYEDEEDNDDDVGNAQQELEVAQEQLDSAENDLNNFDMDGYTALKDFADEFESYASNYMYGAVAIRESYFEDYAKELVSDIGDIPSDLPNYIENNINWEGVAEDLLCDYSAIEFDGQTYYVR